MKEDFNLNKKLLVSLSKDDIQLSSDKHNYTKEQIRDIQSVIEKGLTLYKSKLEIMAVLKNVDVDVVNLMFQKLEQKNPKFFTAYLIRLAFMKQVEVFNDLVYKQHTLLKQYRMDMSVFEKVFPLTDPTTTATTTTTTNTSTSSNNVAPSIQQRIHAHLKGNNSNTTGIPPPQSINNTVGQEYNIHPQQSSTTNDSTPNNSNNSNFTLFQGSSSGEYYPSSSQSQHKQHKQQQQNDFFQRVSPSPSPRHNKLKM
mmetsp:Transcript_13422/g.20274  ORF Transcript_13422/g.20274 Transcript_13422/m.20274 type:complete len:254 (-) Transcript_13422:26-787(-)